MVRELKFSCPAEEPWIEPPVCRDSVLQDVRPLPSVRRRRAYRRRRLRRKAAPTPVAPRRDLAGADWLTDTIPVPPLRRSK